jgi:hypothetical protein
LLLSANGLQCDLAQSWILIGERYGDGLGK